MLEALGLGLQGLWGLGFKVWQDPETPIPLYLGNIP